MLLSALVLASGFGKWHDPEGTRQGVRDFGCPSAWTSLVARALPALEIALAGLLLLDASSAVAAEALAILFGCFSVGMGRLLLQKKSPPCHCFGVIQSKPVTRGTLARALGLLLLAVLCRQLPTYPLTRGGTELAATALGFSITAMVFNRLAGAMRRRMPAAKLRVGQRLPAIRTTRGQWLDQMLGLDRPPLLVGTSTTCPPCQAMEEELDYWTDVLRTRLQVVQLVPNPEASEQHVPLSEQDLALLDIPTPGALLVDPSGTIKIPAVSKREMIEALIRTALKTLGRTEGTGHKFV